MDEQLLIQLLEASVRAFRSCNEHIIDLFVFNVLSVTSYRDATALFSFDTR